MRNKGCRIAYLQTADSVDLSQVLGHIMKDIVTLELPWSEADEVHVGFFEVGT
jgi:hypothetical protein